MLDFAHSFITDPGVADFNINAAEPQELMAPCGIWFFVDNVINFDVPENVSTIQTYDPSAHLIDWDWDFGDPGTFATNLNVFAVWKDRNVSYGKKAYHVFEDPGTYTVSCTGRDSSGAVKEVTRVVTVLDPDVVYSGTRTICVSQASDFTGAPAGSNNVTTMAAAVSALEALGQTGRILLRAGETFVGKVQVDDPMVNFHLGAFGAGAKPIMIPPEPASGVSSTVAIEWRSGNTVQDSVVWGIRFEGEWDAAKETGDPRFSPFLMNTHNVQQDWTAAIYQCEFDGLSSVAPYTAALIDWTAAIVDCDITNWQDYGVRVGGITYHPGAKFAMVGCAIHQKQHACQGDHLKIGLANDHGPFRYSDVMQVITDGCDFYSANSWAGGVQPCIRIAQGGNGAPTGGYFWNGCRLTAEGGSTVGGIDGQNSEAPELPGNHIMSKFFFYNDYATRDPWGVSYGGSTIKDGVIALLDIPEGPSFSSNSQFVSFAQDNPGAGNADAPVKTYNCTFLNLKSDQSPVLFADIANFNDLVTENNVHHAPNQAPAIIASAPIDITTATEINPRNRGIRIGPEKVSATLGSTISNGQTTTMAYPTGTTSADFNAGDRHTVQVAEDNYYFSYRGQCSMSFGATEITITNLSGEDWLTGSLIRIGLDQATLTTDATYSSQGIVVPSARQELTSPAIDGAGTGQSSQTDLLGNVRTGTPDAGAYEGV